MIEQLYIDKAVAARTELVERVGREDQLRAGPGGAGPQVDKVHRVVAEINVPSSLAADASITGVAAVPVDVTVTYAYPKVGLLRFPGAEIVGDAREL